MKNVRRMTFHLPITKNKLENANKRIAKSARKGEVIAIEWKMETG